MFSDTQMDLIMQLHDLGKNPERIQSINEKIKGIIEFMAHSKEEPLEIVQSLKQHLTLLGTSIKSHY
jgi:hypothetical protein